MERSFLPDDLSRTMNEDLAKKCIDGTTTIMWFRRDLRLTDNAAFNHALRENTDVLPVFIFDTNILDELEDKTDRRVAFIHRSIEEMKIQLEKMGSSLLVLNGDPTKIFGELNPKRVYVNEDYEPYTRQRDEGIKSILNKKGSDLLLFKDQVIFSRDEVVKDDGKPYTIFTPYSRKWKSRMNKFYIKPYPVEKYLSNLLRCQPIRLPSLEELGFIDLAIDPPKRVIPQAIIASYDQTRDFPALKGTTRLSVHLRFGTVSIRNLVKIALQKNDVWLSELIWRDFYQMILWHFPYVQTKSFKPGYDTIRWRNNPGEFQAWCDGMTGYPIVDAGMRELNETGFMHNRVRMIVASFLTKHLLVDWRWGEGYFAKKLIDYDLAANNGGWQWAAGSGCDAAPYFRVFNPWLQTEKFDPEMTYIKKWVPEVGTPGYPGPIVDHAFARERVLKAYKTALESFSI